MSEVQPTPIVVNEAESAKEPDALKEAEARLREWSARMCDGEPLDDYIDEFRAQGQSQCTNVWSKGIIAYRCRTCQINDSSAICVECFQNGNHWEHDYVMYHSESGGCCDCGDRAAWKESGFCTAHQRLNVEEAKVKDELLDPTHKAVKYVLDELLFWVKKLSDKLSTQEMPSEQEMDMDVALAMLYLDWSQKVCAVDALRNIVCDDILEKFVIQENNCTTSPLDIFLDCLGWMPEKLIEAETTLFLQLLYQNDFKVKFLDLLKEKYEEMIMLAVNNGTYMRNYKHLDTNLDRVMVQLFNDPEMTTYLIHTYNLLDLFIGVFSKVVAKSADENEVVKVDHEAIKSKVYLRPQGDLRLIVAHGDIAVHMLSKQPELFPKILEVLVKLQWMNPYILDAGDTDFEFENSWTLAIQLEMNSMAVVFQLVSRCFQDPGLGRKTLVEAATYTLKALKQYLEQAKFLTEQDERRRQTVSLHIPLHRTLSAIFQKLVKLPWDNNKRGFLSGLKFEYTEDEVLSLMEHPLRISVWMAQIRAQKWRKASEEFSRLELIYRGSFWHDQSMDMDILLIQFCTIALESMQEKIFIKIAEHFNFKDMVTTRLIPNSAEPKPWRIDLLKDFMRLILLVVRERRNLGEAQEKCLQYDVIQWLCVRDQTYSQLCRALSALPMEHERLNAMLDKVAIYHEPKVADRGYYQLKAEYWEEFDPLFAHYYLNELEEAEDRAVKVGKLDHYWRIKAPPAAGAPYDRLSSLLHTKACHLFLLNVLNEVMHLVARDKTATAGEALGVTALQMMAVLVSDSSSNFRNATSYCPTGPQDKFPTEDIAVNIHVPVRKVSSDGASAEEGLCIHDMLLRFQRANLCTRLVDSANYVLELLCLGTNEKSHVTEVDTHTAEDMQRRLRKEQRQKAILEEFAAKRKAFMELQKVSDDDEGSEDGSAMEVSNIAEESVSCKSGTKSSLETLAKALVPVAEINVATETMFEAQECVLCKRKKDDRNSSTCWIALVQRYNFPSQLLSKGDSINNISADGLLSSSNQIHGFNLIEEGSDQLVTVVGTSDPINATSSSCIDFATTEHVQCCGHQMHFDCFQDHIKTLMLSHDGRGVADPQKAEFFCPTCRRLANVLLPDVDSCILSKKLDGHEDGKGVDETGKGWSGFWQSNKNLEISLEEFCRQVLRVRSQSQLDGLELSRFKICKSLWEGLARNVVHCEVETRDGHMKDETASSSSAPAKLFDESMWGGDSAHWVALRELGRLARLSNTLPGTAKCKSDLLGKLRQSLGLLERRSESQAFVKPSFVEDARSELEKIMQEWFPQDSLDNEQFSELSESAAMSVDALHRENEASGLQESSESTPLSCHVSIQEREERISQYRNLESNLTGEDNKGWHFPESKFGDAHPNIPAAPEPVPPDPQQKFEIKFEESPSEEDRIEDVCLPSQLSPEAQEPMSYSKPEEMQDTWITDILKNGFLTADPFSFLTLLLIVFNGKPDKRCLQAMVKFAYTTAVIQTQMTVLSLGAESSKVEILVQNACLPFLRRAAMLDALNSFATLPGDDLAEKIMTPYPPDTVGLEEHPPIALTPFFLPVSQLMVQIITREDYGLSGTKGTNFSQLQEALQLPHCNQMLLSQVHGARDTLASELLHLHDPVSKGFIFELRTVPRKALFCKLPRVFQELLLENIHNKKKCRNCDDMPADPAICLICGTLLCCGTVCCKVDGVAECSRHAAEESAGVGIFLLLRSTQLLLLRNNRTCMGLSLYLDTHGEEDLYLRRSQLLYLSELRLNEVRRLWMTAAFDYDSYILRNSQSRPKVY